MAAAKAGLPESGLQDLLSKLAATVQVSLIQPSLAPNFPKDSQSSAIICCTGITIVSIIYT